ncbi:MAG: hypothetical protein ACI808_000425 [Paraglaciecola sp.]|jgi:hypothetical protein
MSSPAPGNTMRDFALVAIKLRLDIDNSDIIHLTLKLDYSKITVFLKSALLYSH